MNVRRLNKSLAGKLEQVLERSGQTVLDRGAGATHLVAYDSLTVDLGLSNEIEPDKLLVP